MAAMKLLLVILDGGSAEGLGRADTPYLDTVRQESGLPHIIATAPAPTITYGNHACIMTGRAPGGPGGHGIVGNLFRDPATGEIINLDNHDLADFVQAPTIFEQLAEIDSSLTFGAVAEPVCGGANFVEPMMPFFKIPPLERDSVATELAARIIKDKNPGILIVNFLAVDAAGENHGPESEEYMTVLHEADEHIKRLRTIMCDISGVEPHILVTADHGMHPVNQVVDIHKLLKKEGIETKTAASHRSAHIYLKDQSQIHEASERLIDSGNFSSALRREELETIKMEHARSGDLFVLAAPGIELQKPGLLGSHGAARPEEVEVPLIMSGPEWAKAIKGNKAFQTSPFLYELAPAILKLFEGTNK